MDRWRGSWRAVNRQNFDVMLLLLSFVFSALLAVYMWRRRPLRSATAASVLMMAVAVWSLGYTLELNSPDLATKIFWAKVEYFGIVSVPVAWLSFALHYTGRSEWVTVRNIVWLAVMPATILILVWTNEAHGLIWRDLWIDVSDGAEFLSSEHGTGFWIHSAYSYLILAFGTALLVRALFRARDLYRDQVLAVLGGAMAPWLGNILYLSHVSPWPRLDLTAVNFVVTGLGIAYALFHTHLLDIVPVARDSVLEHLDELVIVLDVNNRVVDLNPSARQHVKNAVNVIGEPIEVLFPDQAALIEHLSRAAQPRAEIVWGQGEDAVYFDVQLSSLRDKRQRFVGRLVVLHDVTNSRRAVEALRRRDAILASVSFCSERFLKVGDWDSAVRESLQHLGEASDVSRVYIFENHAETQGQMLTSQRYEWVAGGFAPQLHNPTLQNLSYESDGYGDWIAVLEQGQLVQAHTRTLAPLQRVLLEAQDTQSVLIVPIFVTGAWWGIIGFDECRVERVWSTAEIEALRAAASAFGAAVERSMADEALRKANDQLDARVRSRTAELEDAVRKLHEEIAERERAQNALRESESKFRSVTQTATEAILFADGEGRVVFVNQAAELMFGYPAPDIVDCNITLVLPQLDGICFRVDAEGVHWLLAPGDHQLHESEGRRRDGTGMPLELTVSTTHIDGKPLFTIIIRDITARKRAEEQLRLYASELERSNQELQQFAYVASHDLQEPLRMVTSYLQILRRRYQGQLDSDADDFIGFAVDGAGRMRELIQGLLDYSRVGTRGRVFGRVDSGAVLAQVLANLQVAMRESGAVVRHGEMPVVWGDATQLGQVLQNLIGNAIKFRGARPPEVEVGAAKRNGVWEFWVKDDGIGIEAQYHERIFAIFQRLHTRDRYPGTGIGLAVCKRIVERHAGRIWVQSAPGEGSTFFFTLPEVGNT
jgi:PAS domain S-box-containing protein